MAKILIVDDDRQITVFLEKLLRIEGYQPTAINDSTQAMATAKSIRPDLFILDLMMPEPNGFELCRMLRAEADFKDTPILIITAMNDGDSQAIAFVAGANAFLAKPFRPDELANKMRELLG